MNRQIGMGAPNHDGDISDLLAVGFGSYLVIHPAHHQVRQIRERQPDALIYLRRFGGIGDNPVGLAYEMAALLDQYAGWGVRDVIAWNEADRQEEGGFDSRTIADFAAAFLAEFRHLRPAARIHWPALAHLERYQGSEPDLWLPVARQFDVIDVHAYHHPNNARAFFQWCQTFLPGKPVALTEYNYGPGNPKPADYGDWLYEVYRLAVEEFRNVETVQPFIWRWHNPEPGVGTSLDLAADDAARAGIRRAIDDFTLGVKPDIPAPTLPQPADHVWTKDLFGDSNDCLFQSITAALDAGTEPTTPTTADLKTAYYRRHPGWNDANETIDLDLFWEACGDLNIDILPLDVQFSNPDPEPHLTGWLTQGYHPTVWIWLWSPPDGRWLLHAVALKGRRDGGYEFYDPQRGFGWWLPDSRFFADDTDGQYAGHCYLPVWRAPVPEKPMSNRERWEPIARREARAVEMDEDVFVRLITQESGWNPEARNPTSGAYGLGQFHPRFYPDAPTWTPAEQLAKAASILADYRRRFGGDLLKAVAAYNGGPVAIERWTQVYGDEWRAALRLYSSEWERVAGYQTTDKAAEVAKYLDIIFGPEDSVTNVRPPAGIDFIGSPNFTVGRDGYRPLAIVNHVMEGTLAACDAWFGDRDSQVSAHFGVGKNGEIHQYVTTSNTAWANGRLARPDRTVPWIDRCVLENINPNAVTVSIEREGHSAEAPTEAQYQAILALHRYVCAYWGIPATRQHIVGHYQLDAVRRPKCPGNFPWERLLADLNPTTPRPATVSRQAALDEIFRVAGEIANRHPDTLPEVTTIHRMVDVLK